MRQTLPRLHDMTAVTSGSVYNAYRNGSVRRAISIVMNAIPGRRPFCLRFVAHEATLIEARPPFSILEIANVGDITINY